MRQVIFSVAMISFVAVGASAQQQEKVEKKPAKIEAKTIKAKKVKPAKKARTFKVEAVRPKEAIKNEEATKEEEK